MHEDDEEFQVTFGTAFSEDNRNLTLIGNQKRQPVAYEQRVLNEKGKSQRFHGAFTGGFSAGYYNTVGSKKGWTPSSFVSTRSDESRINKKQRPEDFMDDEDLGLFGIAPRSIKPRQEFDDTHINKTLRSNLGSQSVFGRFDDASDKIKDLIVPSSTTIKDRLLRRMGFKNKIAKATFNLEMGRDRMENDIVAANSFGEIVHKSFEACNGFLEYPKIDFESQPTSFGLGYERLDVNNYLNINKRSEDQRGFNPFGNEKQVRVGIHGEAFGVGAQENEDEDLFEQPGMSNYDFSISSDIKSKFCSDSDNSNDDEEFEGMVSSKSSLKRSTKFKDAYEKKKTRTSIPKESLAGFHLSRDPSEQEFKAQRNIVSIPTGFKPFFDPICILSPREKLKGVEEAMKLRKERKLLPEGWKPVTISMRTSILDSSDDEDITAGPKTEEAKIITKLSETTRILRAIKNDTKNGTRAKPFLNNSAKQTRFELFSLLMRRNNISEQEAYRRSSKESNLSIQAMEDELDEFRRELVIQNAKEKSEITETSTLHQQSPEVFQKPLFSISEDKQKLVAKMLSSRFRSVGTVDISQELSEEELLAKRKSLNSLNISDPRDHAALTEAYGTLTRRKLTWYPDNLLCRRMNVANPYPDARFVGCPEDRRISVKDPLGRRRRRRRRWDNPEDEQDTLIAIVRDGRTEQDQDENLSDYTTDEDEEAQIEEELSSLDKRREKSSVLFNNIFDAYEKGVKEQNRPKPLALIPPLMLTADSIQEENKEFLATESLEIRGPSIPVELREQLERESDQKNSLSLFKSIFASDEEIEEEEEEEEIDEEEFSDGNKTKTISPVATVIRPPIRDVEEIVGEDLALAPQPHILFAHLYAGDSLPVLANRPTTSTQEIDKNSNSVSVENLKEDYETYGPILPPGIFDPTVSVSIESSDSSEDSDAMVKSALKWVADRESEVKRHKKSKKKKEKKEKKEKKKHRKNRK